ncbi:MAG TPA: ECF-type sigma factor, partial [Longimicrobiaceae bacterium]|nr:ECF-type sigma factor [Longimicrobiaceae bacterium]
LLMPSSPPQDPRTPAPPDAAAGAAASSRDELDRTYARLYEELRALARRHLGRDGAVHTLSPTALVHESYLKLADLVTGHERSRAQFFALASRAMRHILVDHARGRNAQKRGGGALQVTLHPELAADEPSIFDLLTLDDALSQLGQLSERLERVVECRFFGGLSVPETAEALGTSVRTIEREWTRARAYLYQLLAGDGA